MRIASASAFADRLPDCRQALRRVARPEPGGSVGPPALQASILLALEAYQTGQWDEAWRLAETTAGAVRRRGYQLLRQQAQTVLALVAACRGDAETAQALADEITRWAAPRGLTSLLAGAHYACALAALAQSDFPAAYQQAARISPAGRHPGPRARSPRGRCSTWSRPRCAPAGATMPSRMSRPPGRPGLAAASPRMALLVDRRDGDDRAR